jgi:hypothetical protein
MSDASEAVGPQHERGVEDLDETFGRGRSGDLLVSTESRQWLVEVTGVTGAPSEAEVSGVVRHRLIWPNLGRAERLDGAVVIIGHHLRLPPAARSALYVRQELVESLEGFGVTVVDCVRLGRWWAQGNCVEIVDAITGPPRQHA